MVDARDARVAASLDLRATSAAFKKQQLELPRKHTLRKTHNFCDHIAKSSAIEKVLGEAKKIHAHQRRQSGLECRIHTLVARILQVSPQQDAGP